VTVETLLAELRLRDVELRPHGAGLRCSGPPGALTPDLRDEIARRKSEILAILGAPRAIVPIHPQGSGTPVFGVPGHNGDVFCWSDFVRDLGDHRPFFGLEPPGLDGHSAPLTRIDDLAAYFEEQIAAFRPAGPCIVAGYCAGGAVAFELGRRLRANGRNVLFVGLFGSPHPSWYQLPAQVSFRLRQEFGRVSKHARALWFSPSGRLRYVTDSMSQIRWRREAASAATRDPVLARRRAMERVTVAAVRRHRIRPFPGRLVLFVPNRTWLPSSVPLWRAAASDTLVHYGPAGCRQDSMLRRNSADFAALFRRACEEHEPLVVTADAASRAS
jgi:thioesterase domain-containing protein